MLTRQDLGQANHHAGHFGWACKQEIRCSYAAAWSNPAEPGLQLAAAILSDHHVTSSHPRRSAGRADTATDTNGIGCHDPLLDASKLSPQVSDHLGQLRGRT